MQISSPSRLWPFSILAASLFFLSGCTAALGPGYTIEKQDLAVQFLPALEPRILVRAEYHLRNSGNQPLSAIEIRSPGRRFHVAAVHAEWDGALTTLAASPANPRNSILTIPQPWSVSTRHSLRLSFEIVRAAGGDNALNFTSDAFFLPAQGWCPELLPARGSFATGGVPPKQWDLMVRVPSSFLVHTSGHLVKSSRAGGEIVTRAAQRAVDPYPFVVAGRYSETKLKSASQKIFLWTRSPQDTSALRQNSDALARSIQAYDATFGAPKNDTLAIWLVECPASLGCFTSRNSVSARLLGEENEPLSAELVSMDTVMVDPSTGQLDLVTSAAPFLAASWLGYAQNPGFFSQRPPLSQFPVFFAAVGLAAVEGHSSRAKVIRSALRLVPKTEQPLEATDETIIRAKSLLFFYALEDHYGEQAFRNAMRHMLYARRERGFDLNDLLAAFDAETQQNTAAFERMWMKHSGVPQEFRARYE